MQLSLTSSLGTIFLDTHVSLPEPFYFEDEPDNVYYHERWFDTQENMSAIFACANGQTYYSKTDAQITSAPTSGKISDTLSAGTILDNLFPTDGWDLSSYEQAGRMVGEQYYYSVHMKNMDNATNKSPSLGMYISLPHLKAPTLSYTKISIERMPYTREEAHTWVNDHVHALYARQYQTPTPRSGK